MSSIYSALKTVVVNSFSAPLAKGSNCEDDHCTALGNFVSFLQNTESSLEPDDISEEANFNLGYKELGTEDNQATAYVAGYLKKKVELA